MKLKPLTCSAFVMYFLLTGIPLFAHHGTGVAYDTEKTVTLKGTVTEWIWANPHCGLLFDVTDEAGNVVHWGAEMGNPHALSQSGFSKDVFKPGDKVTVSGHVAKSGAPRLTASRIVLADGHVLPERRVKGNGVDLNDEPSQ
jgi:Family of unknown function (DUF6152)